jgi:hypothetical protein
VTTRTITTTDDNCTRYIVSGDLGAVVCSTMAGSRVPFLIDYHHKHPYDEDTALPCDVLAEGACYPEAGAGVAMLHRKWQDAGADDGIIWAELERRYAQMTEG